MIPPMIVHPDPQGVFPHAAVTYAVVGVLIVIAVALVIWVGRARARQTRAEGDTKGD